MGFKIGDHIIYTMRAGDQQIKGSPGITYPSIQTPSAVFGGSIININKDGTHFVEWYDGEVMSFLFNEIELKIEDGSMVLNIKHMRDHKLNKILKR
jgi:hypothetical protein